MLALKAENISKQYRLGQVGTGTLSHDLNRFWHRVRGKEDPYLKIGETNDRATKGDSEYVWSLRDINFEIEQGDAVGIIGRNGAGKSTLLKLLSKVTKPTTGTIYTRGRIASLLEVGTGFHPEMTGRENVFLNGAILGMTRKEITRKFDEIVDFSGVERYIDTPVKRYSSGMYVRLAFAVAAHLESEILIVDEVLAVGDAEFQKKCLGKMGDVSKGEGRTVLFVSHNMAAVKNLCKSGIMLSKGQIGYIGDTETAIDKYLSVADSTISALVDFPKKKYTSPFKSKINSISLKSATDGNLQHTFRMGENIMLEIEIELLESFEQLNINVRLDDPQGNRIAGWRTSENGFLINAKQNIIRICLTIEQLNIFDGDYIFSIAFLDGKTTIDYIEDAITFKIVPSKIDLFAEVIAKSNNLIYTPSKWNQIK